MRLAWKYVTGVSASVSPDRVYTYTCQVREAPTLVPTWGARISQYPKNQATLLLILPQTRLVREFLMLSGHDLCNYLQIGRRPDPDGVQAKLFQLQWRAPNVMSTLANRGAMIATNNCNVGFVLRRVSWRVCAPFLPCCHRIGSAYRITPAVSRSSSATFDSEASNGLRE